uniref:NGF domain-containing protein n=1 Tax=Caenorhabditis japonica TaxID=281687 RepID=A0A8R1HMM4_CAEJA
MPSIVQFLVFFTVVNVSTSYVVVVEPLVESISEEDVASAPSDPILLRKRKSLLVGLSEHTEEVCKTKIRQNHRPQYGHIANGSRVEIQQDEESSLEATFVECMGENRPSCHGVDHDLFISECVTVYEHRPAHVRIAKSNTPYFPATVRVPILCECRLRRHFRDFAKRK